MEDKDTRQAIMRISRPEHQWSGCRDQPCTTHLNWLIRDNKLNLTTVMRSNDLVKGTVWDLSFFMSLMPEMLEELKSTYADLEIGTYSHFAHSLHIYDSNMNVILKMIGRS
jgi:thymidylate synthase